MSRAIVLQALEERRILRVTYALGGVRMIQPHDILRKPVGTELLEAFQVQGFTEVGVEHGWKHFEIARLHRVELGDERFEPRRDFKPVSSAHGVVIAGVRSTDQPDGDR